jgi:hypothetical protein
MPGLPDGGALPPSLCGNGVVDAYERCDGSDLGVFTCRALGYDGGELRCNLATCQFDTIACTMFATDAGGSPGPDFGDDAGLLVCVPSGPCMIDTAAKGVCHRDGFSCEHCVSNEECWNVYGVGYVCFSGDCAIPL